MAASLHMADTLVLELVFHLEKMCENHLGSPAETPFQQKFTPLH